MGKKALLRTTIAFVVALITGITPQVYGASGDNLWGDTYYTGSSSDKVQSTLVAMDHQGNIVAASTSRLSWRSYRFYVVSFDKDRNKRWEKTFDGRSAVRPVVDSNDNVVVAYLSNDHKEWVVVSISPEGRERWRETISLGSLDDNTYYENIKVLADLAVDHHDNIVVAGLAVDSEGDYAGRVVSLSSSGAKNWDKHFKKVSRTPQIEGWARAIAIGDNNNVVVAGTTYNGEIQNIYLVSYSSEGEVNWWYTSTDNAPQYSYAVDIALDHDGNAIVVGASIGGSWGWHYKWRILSVSPEGELNWERFYPREEETGGGEPMKVAIDTNGEIKVLGYMNSGEATITYWRIVSYSPSGEYQWTARANEITGGAVLNDIAIDRNNNLFGVGYWKTNRSNTFDITLICLNSATGREMWTEEYDYGDQERGDQLAIDLTTGNLAVVGRISNRLKAQLLYVKGYPQPGAFEKVLKAGGEVRTISSHLEACDASQGRYLGFGDAATGGDTFKVEAEFPQYIDQQTEENLQVKIFVACQLPFDPSYLFFFDSQGLKVIPPDTLAPWKENASGFLEPETILPPIQLTGDLLEALKGTHYWYTLVVPNTAADDLSDVDWENDPWEITVSTFEIE